MASSPGPSRARQVVQATSGLAVATALVAAGVLLFPRPLADVFFTGWVLVAVGLTVLGAGAAWTERTMLVWVAGLLLTALSIVGIWSIGFLLAPSAILLLLAAGVSQWAGPRRSVPSDIEDPPSVLEAVHLTLAGSGSVLLGTGLFYEGVFVRELFSRGCATETLDCALAVTRWDAVGLTLLGLVAGALGCWIVWRQLSIGRALAARHPG